MKKNLLLIHLLLFAGIVHAQDIKVLFIGNSYTASNNLPEIVKDCAVSAGDNLFVQAHMPGGTRLMSHASDPVVYDLIRSEEWDYVVLQAQSQEPSWPISQVQSEVFPYAKQLCDSIRSIHPCAMPLFFMTWGRENGDQYNCASWPPVCTYEGMDSLLNLRYRMMAEDNDAYVAPVGAVWRYIRENFPQVNLYEPDESHPNATGSYVAAMTFYSLIFQKDPNLVSHNAHLGQQAANNVRSVVKTVVYDSLSKWNVGKYKPKADFEYSIDSNQLQLTNTSTFGLEYLWYFGDGNSSGEKNPVHIYASDGEYTLRLYVSKCGQIDSISKNITISTTALPEEMKPKCTIFPNPSHGFIEISDPEMIKSIEICDQQGKMVYSYKVLVNGTLEISDLKKGIYFLTIHLKHEQGYFSERFSRNNPIRQ
jgi:hypothetical protein